jgi:CheY-like chemotaxis protein
MEEAQRTAQALMPQAVVIDRTCEGCAELDGSRLRALMHQWGLSRAPLMVWCPLPSEALRQRLAIEGYLVKPISRQSVWDVMRRMGDQVNKVLIVDDDRDFVRLLSRMLEDSPVRRYEVASAHSGQQALIKMRQSQPDLLLLDVRLPDLDGFQVIERVRSDPALVSIPIIIVSAREETDHQRALPGVMTIAKPDGLMPSEVVQWVQHAVDMAVTSSAATPAPQATPAARRASAKKRLPLTKGPAPSA